VAVSVLLSTEIENRVFLSTEFQSHAMTRDVIVVLSRGRERDARGAVAEFEIRPGDVSAMLSCVGQRRTRGRTAARFQALTCDVLAVLSAARDGRAGTGPRAPMPVSARR
jgi:hypothetical protein